MYEVFGPYIIFGNRLHDFWIRFTSFLDLVVNKTYYQNLHSKIYKLGDYTVTLRTHIQ